MLEQITPVVLTFNEAPNIERTLGRLTWARDVVVVDSGSTDDTVARAQRFANVRVVRRPFDGHAAQWSYAVHDTGLRSDWVLALDADYVLSDELIEELRALEPLPSVVGGRAEFRYCVEGRPLRASLYPPVTVLFRRSRAKYIQSGHTQRVVVDGEVRPLRGPIFHDDRKPLSRWLAAQDRYMELESRELLARRWGELGWAGRLRRYTPFAPGAVFFYCLFRHGLLLEGRAGFIYTLQRTYAEVVLLLKLFRHRLLAR